MNISIAGRIEQANGRLKAANVGVVIELHGTRLYLRAMLPPKPGTTKQPSQQRISLSNQGIRANPIGIKEAEAEARKVGALLARREFSWEAYLKPQDKPSLITVGDWVKRFEADYFSSIARTPESETTWRGDYLKVFNKLPIDATLSSEILIAAILNTAPNTRTRKRTVMVLTRLAKFAQLDVDFKNLAGNYSPTKVAPRDLPDDYAIASWYYKIPAGCWRWAYGVLATYGLRNHELFYLDFSKFPVVLVQDGKTGQRWVYPVYPEWATDWELKDVCLPKCSGKTNSDLGNRVTHAFKRLGVPFHPYDLRHAWAVRSLEFGLDVSLAAQQMGHSVKVHSDIYHHWISEDVHQRAFNALINKSDRPKPPEIFLA